MFLKRTTAKIVGSLQKTVDDLRNHADASLEEARFHHDQADEHRATAHYHEDEADSAHRIADKIAGLLQ